MRSSLTGENPLKPSKTKRALIDESIATKLMVTTSMKASKQFNRPSISDTSFHDSKSSALHGGVSMRDRPSLSGLEENLPGETVLRDRLRDLEFEYPPLKSVDLTACPELHSFCVVASILRRMGAVVQQV